MRFIRQSSGLEAGSDGSVFLILAVVLELNIVNLLLPRGLRFEGAILPGYRALGYDSLD